MLFIEYKSQLMFVCVCVCNKLICVFVTLRIPSIRLGATFLIPFPYGVQMMETLQTVEKISPIQVSGFRIVWLWISAIPLEGLASLQWDFYKRNELVGNLMVPAVHDIEHICS